MKILVTGAAGFIGFYLVQRLIERGDKVVGLDNINDYYDVNLKLARLTESGIDTAKINWNEKIQSSISSDYHFIRLELEDKENLFKLCSSEKFDCIVNLAAQAGVRYSIINPDVYVQSNIVGFLNILEAARNHDIKHLVYASSSSIYGLNKKMPFSVTDSVDNPISLYAATKKSNELMAHTYSHLYNIPTTGLRFFTVYGPWGRPDMAYFLFCDQIAKGQSIKVFNHGKMKRDFTYIDDIITGIVSVLDKPATRKVGTETELETVSTTAPYAIYNIGNNKPVELLTFIKEIEANMGKEAIIEMLDMQPGDVPATWADIDDLIKNFNYKPSTTIETGIAKFINWYKSYYSLNF